MSSPRVLAKFSSTFHRNHGCTGTHARFAHVNSVWSREDRITTHRRCTSVRRPPGGILHAETSCPHTTPMRLHARRERHGGTYTSCQGPKWPCTPHPRSSTHGIRLQIC